MTVSGQRSFHPVTSFNLGRSATSGVVAHGLRASRRARPRVSCAAMLQLTALLLVAQIQLPPPRGYVNDFAGVLDSASVAHMEAVITEVRAKTRDRKSTRLNSSHSQISYAVFCLKKNTTQRAPQDTDWLDDVGTFLHDAGAHIVNDVASFSNAMLNHPGLVAPALGGLGPTTISAA